jgi:hypothetical protein
MKRLILIPAFLTAIASGFAQTECSQNNPIYKFDNNGAPKEIHTLGSNPEFPFLRNLSSSGQVYSAIKKNNKKNTHGMSELNSMLMEIGMANGANDLQESSITAATIAAGTDGNMGYGGYGSEYSVLSNNTKAWKISSGTGSCFVYIMAKCGNAFFPKSAMQRTACLDVPVSLTADTKEVTLEGAPPSATTEKVYVYYDRRHRKHNLAPEFADLNDPRASTPILVNTDKNVQPVPQSYKVSVNTPEDNVRVCPDVPLNVQANINVEKESEYTGYYPAAAKNTYKLVSRRVYRITARKMRKAERKEARVARLTKMPVNSHEGRA